MKRFSKFFTFLALTALIISIAACGKISDPIPYEDSGYPHIYPQH